VGELASGTNIGLASYLTTAQLGSLICPEKVSKFNHEIAKRALEARRRTFIESDDATGSSCGPIKPFRPYATRLCQAHVA